ncbi:farnesyltransferas-like protein [Microthyrium microscopicum]|uniref:Protein farnesyltransferase/geranylgeranyltransferase type-1 subunit alpha n=1 Tax=Microthyrium microscopicum TaxID=703497 RepID=A0A6A6UGX3_9PEZI|nr:farnesyltransferas-like protein [Microthyrium microscopicum]
MGKYADSPEWADVVPISQQEHMPAPLAQIAYTDEYAEAMSYLRATMASNELSERVLALTEDIIRLNPSHYTVWLYRFRTLSALPTASLTTELTTFLNPLSLRHLKNYQIWHHRQLLVSAIGSYEGEAEFLVDMFAKDAKNYHVWSYRQWLVRHFKLFHSASELAFTEQLIGEDVRNNSAWNHRWHVNFADGDGLSDSGLVAKELEYAMGKIELAAQNESAWNYLRGLLAKGAGVEESKVVQFAVKYAGLDGGEVKSTHALDLLASIYGKDPAKKESAVQALELLADKYDPIRAPYWRYRLAMVNSGVAAS